MERTDNSFGCNYWIDTEGAEDFTSWLEELKDEAQMELQIREMDGELNPEDGLASPVEGIGADFSPAGEYVEGYLALRDAAEGEELEKALDVLEQFKADGIKAEELEAGEGGLLEYLSAALAKEGIQNVKLEMMPAPVSDPDGLIRCCKGEEETFSEFQMDGRIDAEKASETEEGTEVLVSVGVRCEYREDSYLQGRVSKIPVLL